MKKKKKVNHKEFPDKICKSNSCVKDLIGRLKKLDVASERKRRSRYGKMGNYPSLVNECFILYFIFESFKREGRTSIFSKAYFPKEYFLKTYFSKKMNFSRLPSNASAIVTP